MDAFAIVPEIEEEHLLPETTPVADKTSFIKRIGFWKIAIAVIVVIVIAIVIYWYFFHNKSQNAFSMPNNIFKGGIFGKTSTPTENVDNIDKNELIQLASMRTEKPVITEVIEMSNIIPSTTSRIVDEDEDEDEDEINADEQQSNSIQQPTVTEQSANSNVSDAVQEVVNKLDETKFNPADANRTKISSEKQRDSIADTVRKITGKK